MTCSYITSLKHLESASRLLTSNVHFQEMHYSSYRAVAARNFCSAVWVGCVIRGVCTGSFATAAGAAGCRQFYARRTLEHETAEPAPPFGLPTRSRPLHCIQIALVLRQYLTELFKSPTVRMTRYAGQ